MSRYSPFPSVLILRDFLVHWHVKQTHHDLLSLSREHSSSKEAEGHNKEVRKSLIWVTQVRGLSRKLSLHLSMIVDACESSKYAVNFQNLSESADSHLLLPGIQITFDELELLKKRLESLAVCCNDITRDVSLDYPSTSLDFAKTAHRTVTDKSIGKYSLKSISIMKPLKWAIVSASWHRTIKG